jgi:hypothetical protein
MYSTKAMTVPLLVILLKAVPSLELHLRRCLFLLLDTRRKAQKGRSFLSTSIKESEILQLSLSFLQDQTLTGSFIGNFRCLSS